MKAIEQIEQEAASLSDPVEGSGCGEMNHQHDCQCSSWEDGYIAGAKAHSLNVLEEVRLEWSLSTFIEATPISSLRKLEFEILEIEADINNGKPDPTEYADALMCLLDSAGRAGLTVPEILKAFKEKTEVNKRRTWRKNPDNSYSHV